MGVRRYGETATEAPDDLTTGVYQSCVSLGVSQFSVHPRAFISVRAFIRVSNPLYSG